MMLLKKIGKISTGNTPSKKHREYYNSDDIGFVKPDSISDTVITEINKTSSFISENAREKARVAPKGSILITCIGSVGKVGIVTEGEYAFNQQINAIMPNKDVNQKYLAYNLLYNKQRLINIANAPVVPIVNKTQLENFEIKFDSNIDAQKKIVEQLDGIALVIDKRKKQFDALDELIKARFVEMFGDARKNPNKYDTVSFIDIVEYMGDIGSNGANKVVVDHLDMKDKEDYAMMVRFTNFTKNDFTDDVKYVSKEAYDFFKKSQIFGGELIICKIGSAGQNYVMPYLNRPVSLGLNQIMVRIKDNILMSYLYQYLHTDYGEFLISGCINGAVTKTITKTELKKIPVMLPPMELQREFVAFVEQVDKSKAVIEKSLKELETLQASLMQKYFS